MNIIASVDGVGRLAAYKTVKTPVVPKVEEKPVFSGIV